MSNFFYNIKLNKQDLQNTNGRIEFNKSYLNPIIENPSDWELSIERFTVPMSNIPIFFFENNKYIVSIRIVASNNIEYKKSEYITIVPSIPENLDFNDKIVIWNIKDFLDGINISIKNCILYIMNQPNFPLVDKLNLYTQLQYDTINKRNRILYQSEFHTKNWELYFNDPLFSYFQGFQNEIYTDPIYRYKIKTSSIPDNTYNIGGNNYLSVYEEWNNIPLWSALQSILFETSMPVETEIVGTENNVYRYIISDFIPIQDDLDRSSIQYYNTGNLRWYPLSSKTPLYNINLFVKWEDRNNVVRAIYIPELGNFEIKIHFRKKID